MQERIAQKQWIPLSYIAAYEALGWDARPLKEHRAYMLELRRAASRERELLHHERRDQQCLAEEQRRQAELQQVERTFRNGEFIAAEHFIGLCDKYGIAIHPRTLGTLRNQIENLSRTHIRYKSGGRGIRTPALNGCSRLIDQLTEKLQ